jgi:hypothetical protein
METETSPITTDISRNMQYQLPLGLLQNPWIRFKYIRGTTPNQNVNTTCYKWVHARIQCYRTKGRTDPWRDKAQQKH